MANILTRRGCNAFIKAKQYSKNLNMKPKLYNEIIKPQNKLIKLKPILTVENTTFLGMGVGGLIGFTIGSINSIKDITNYSNTKVNPFHKIMFGSDTEHNVRTDTGYNIFDNPVVENVICITTSTIIGIVSGGVIGGTLIISIPASIICGTSYVGINLYNYINKNDSNLIENDINESKSIKND
jgi:hypothetical protein